MDNKEARDRSISQAATMSAVTSSLRERNAAIYLCAGGLFAIAEQLQRLVDLAEKDNAR